MRRTLVVLGLLVLLCSSPGAVAAPRGTEAQPPRRHLQLSARATFSLELDYGDHPNAVFNGRYRKTIDYDLRAIVVYDGTRATLLPGASMVVDGHSTVEDDRTQGHTTASGIVRRPVSCAAPGERPDHPGLYQDLTGQVDGSTRYEFTQRGRFAVSNAGLVVDPGSAIKASVGCAATEALPNHGLPGGPWLRVAPPPRSLFRGTRPFAIRCYDSHEHAFVPATGGNGHAFKGQVAMDVTLRPFRAAALPAVKRRLRDSVGTEELGDTTGPRADCVR